MLSYVSYSRRGQLHVLFLVLYLLVWNIFDGVVTVFEFPWSPPSPVNTTVRRAVPFTTKLAYNRITRGLFFPLQKVFPFHTGTWNVDTRCCKSSLLNTTFCYVLVPFEAVFAVLIRAYTVSLQPRLILTTVLFMGTHFDWSSSRRSWQDGQTPPLLILVLCVPCMV